MAHVLTKAKSYKVKTRVKKADKTPSVNREQWLTNFAEIASKRIEEFTSKRTPNFLITTGWPSRNGISNTKQRIGECWNKAVCIDGTHQLFISPLLGSQNIMGLASTVVHEVAHANVGTEHGHNKVFGQAVRPLGLIGKLTATEAGPEFVRWVDPILAKLGPFPMQGMKVNKNFKTQPTRSLKVECPRCDFKVRMTQVWIDAEGYGPPRCPMHDIEMVPE